MFYECIKQYEKQMQWIGHVNAKFLTIIFAPYTHTNARPFGIVLFLTMAITV
jgi:hypothetical protein